MENCFERIIRDFEDSDISDEKVIDLIYQLAESGDRFKFASEVYDFASTGGPSSLSTILVPLYLYACGVSVINIAVPGRPAGAVDVLGQIPGYQLSINSMNICNTEHFYLHFEANEHFAPLDKLLFNYRKKVNKIDNPNLAIASLLSKKLASGATNIGLDVRVSQFGNFGKSWSDSVHYSEKYNRIARNLGIRSLCFLSDATAPYQPYIGRGEALVAIYKVLNGQSSSALERHNRYCMEIAQRMTGTISTVTTGTIKKAFSENLLRQGTKYECFEEAVDRVLEQPYREICATSSGNVYYMLSQIRQYLVGRQNMDNDRMKYPDPSGIILLHEQGEKVEAGEPVLIIRNSVPQLEDSYSFFAISDDASGFQDRREVI